MVPALLLAVVFATPYSLPWRLRPVTPVTVLRLDNDLASYVGPDGARGLTDVAVLLGGLARDPFMASARLGVLRHAPPSGEPATSVTNLALGGAYAFAVPAPLRVSAFLGLAAPTGSAQGDEARAGVLARSAMDNALFATDDVVVFPGVDVAWVDHGVTVQLEATVLQLVRVKGDGDDARTNLTTGLHVGAFVVPWLSLGGELRYQRWLSTPAAIAADATGTLRDSATIALGARGLVKARGVALRPGLSVTRGLDAPMSSAAYTIIQADAVVVFP